MNNKTNMNISNKQETKVKTTNKCAINMDSNNWISVLICVFAGVVGALQVAKLSIAAPFLVSDLSIGHDTIGGLGSIFSLLGMLGGIPIATLALRAGLKRSVLLGVLAICFSSLIPTVVPDLWVLYITRIIEGLGLILVAVTAPTLLQAQVQLQYKNIAMSYWSCFMPVGIALMMFLGVLFNDWQSIWLANFIVALVCFLLVFFFVPEVDQGTRRISFTNMWYLLLGVIKAPTAIRIALVFTCYNLMYFAFYNFLPLLVVEKLPLQYFYAGVITGVAAIANIVGNLVSGVLLSKGLTRKRVFAFSFVIMSTMGWLIFTGDLPPYVVTIAAILFTGIGGMLPTAVLSSATLVAPVAASIPITLGLYMQGSNLGQFIGPFVVGIGTELFGWEAAGPVFLSLGLIGLTLVFARSVK